MLPPADLHPPLEPRDVLFQSQPSKAAFMRTRLSLPTGVELDVLQSGDPTGVPLVLLHGLSDSLASMRPMMEHLPQGVRVIAITQLVTATAPSPPAPTPPTPSSATP